MSVKTLASTTAIAFAIVIPVAHADDYHALAAKQTTGWREHAQSPTPATNRPRKALHSSRAQIAVHTRRSVPPNTRGQDQLSIPGWPDELRF